LAELQGYVDRGMSIHDIKQDIQRRHPKRVRGVFTAPDPGKYSPSAVRKLRDRMGMSQATFAQVIGISRILAGMPAPGYDQRKPL
jgi:DNA-binding transcriptional regulator YiaG